MAVIIYQVIIALSLCGTRLFFPKKFLVVALVWTAFTIFNLFFPPLIILQLTVIWGCYWLMRLPSEGASSASGTKPVQASEPPPKAPQEKSVRLRMTDAVILPPPVEATSGRAPAVRPASPSWANSEKLGQFKAGAMGDGMDVHSLPITFVLECINDPDILKRLLSEAAQNEREGCSFEEQQARAARSLSEMWRNASDGERAASQENDARLGRIKL